MTINHVDNRSTIDFIVNNLNGFSNYSFAISACTLSGCSRFSRLVHFLTDENGKKRKFFSLLFWSRNELSLTIFVVFRSVPSKPSEVFFPEVDHWSAKMIWQKPRQINGILLGYRLIYWQSDDEQTRVVVDNLTATSQTYLVESELIEHFCRENETRRVKFIFIWRSGKNNALHFYSVRKNTCRLWWSEYQPIVDDGKTRFVLIFVRFQLLTKWKFVFSADRPAAPHPPTVIESTINSTSLVLTWRKDSDFNYAPIRYTYVEIQNETNSFWSLYEPLEKADGQTTSLLIEKFVWKRTKRYKDSKFSSLFDSVWKRTTLIDFEFSRKTIWAEVILVDRQIGFEQKNQVRWEIFWGKRPRKSSFFSFFRSAPTVRPEIDFLVSDEPCQLYIRLKVIRGDSDRSERNFDFFSC